VCWLIREGDLGWGFLMQLGLGGKKVRGRGEMINVRTILHHFLKENGFYTIMTSSQISSIKSVVKPPPQEFKMKRTSSNLVCTVFASIS
jgi:hypothetical protein